MAIPRNLNEVRPAWADEMRAVENLEGRYAGRVSNRLVNSSSAYLRQHARNPVDWWPWGPEALSEAIRLDRPIFLSIGYAAGHWCHVMAQESFEDIAIAEFLNANFIPVKVDREERPDVDAIYMAATQLVAGHGGWPMSVFLLADGRPFMAGTYYPPSDRNGHVGFLRLLHAMDDAWRNQRSAVVTQSQEIHRSLEREVSFIDHLAPLEQNLDLSGYRRVLRNELVARVDPNGGFGEAPKFPRPSYVESLLEFDDDASRRAIEITLDSMSRRGLYDHIEGGFARYSVDATWHVPHFEKMLSDQALLARCFLRAGAVFGRNDWRDVALETLRFVIAHMQVEQGFASSLDADAGGVEGAHVTWTGDEVMRALCGVGLEHLYEATVSRWRINDPGEFEGRSIPRLADSEPFSCPDDLSGAREALRGARRLRVQPSRDEKVILEWNAMLASALVRSGVPDLVERGLQLLGSLHESHFDGEVWWRTEQRSAHATTLDLTWLIDALVDAFESSGDDRWTEAAKDVASYLLAHYWDEEIPSPQRREVGGGFYSVSDLVSDLDTRPKDVFDGATPSSHALACRSLARLALCTGDESLLVVSQRLVTLGARLLAEHAMAVPDLLDAAGFANEGVEIVIPGDQGPLCHGVRLMTVPRSVLITGSGTSALLKDRRSGFAYVCRSGVCQLPVESVSALEEQLRGGLF